MSRNLSTRLSLKQRIGNRGIKGIEESGNPIPHFKDCLCQSLKLNPPCSAYSPFLRLQSLKQGIRFYIIDVRRRTKLNRSIRARDFLTIDRLYTASVPVVNDNE